MLTYALLADLVREQNCTAVVVTHDTAVAAIADRVVRMRDGRVSGESLAGSENGREEAIVVGRGGWLRLPEELLLAPASAPAHTRACTAATSSSRPPATARPRRPASRPRRVVRARRASPRSRSAA